MKLPSAIVAGACAGAVASLLVTALPARTVVADAVPATDLGPADRLLLSKTDLVDADHIETLSQRLNRMNPRAAMPRCR